MMNALSRDDARPLPGPIVQVLNRLIRRARRLIVFRGLCASVAAGGGAFLVIMLLDAWLTLLASWPRWLLTITAYAVWGGVTHWYLVRPLARSFTLAGIARLIESHHPELQERISSAVELLASRDMPSIRGSEVLIQALTEQAVREAASLRPRKEISFRIALPFAVAAGLMLAVLAGLSIAMPRKTGFLVARAAAPFLNLPNVRALDLRIEPGDTLVAAGGSLAIRVTTRNPVVKYARLRMVDGQERETVADMVAVPAASNATGRAFALTLPGVLQEFRYRIQAGDALSRYYKVRVAVPPVIGQRDIRYRYPAYTGIAPRLDRDGSGTIRAIAGTEITVSVQINKPVVSAVLAIAGSATTNTIKGASVSGSNGSVPDYEFSFVLPAGLNGVWTLRLTDEIGLQNSAFEHSIQAIPDTPPVISVTNPRQRELRLNRDTRLPVFYAVEDDLGLQGVSLVLSVPGRSNDIVRPMPLVLPPTGQPGRTARGSTLLALDDSILTNAPRLTFRMVATDNLPAGLRGPQKGQSEIFTILLDEAADSWMAQVLASQDQRVVDGLKLTRQQLEKARQQSAALEAPLARDPQIDADTSRKVDALQDTLAAADNTLRDTSGQLQKGFFDSLASNLNALAENHVAKAESQAGQIKLMDSPADRAAMNSNVASEISRSLDEVGQAIRTHEKAREAARRAVALDQMSESQAQLARERRSLDAAAASTNTAEQAAADTADRQWRQEQDRVADALARMTRETPEAAALLAGALSNSAMQAAAESDRLARKQSELAALTRDALEQRMKQEEQWRQLAQQQEQLARRTAAVPMAAPQAETMRNASREMEAGDREQARESQERATQALREKARTLEQHRPAQPREAGVRQAKPEPPEEWDPFRELVDEAEKAGQEQRDVRKDREASPVEAAKEAARNAEQAGDLADRSAKAAEQAAKEAGQAVQQAEQRAEAAKKALQQAEQAAGQAAQAEQQGKGKPNERETLRAAEEARKEAQAARQNEANARQDTAEAKQAGENARQQAEQARQAAEAARQSAKEAEQAAAETAKAESMARAREQEEAASRAAEKAVEQARQSAEAAARADQFADTAKAEAKGPEVRDPFEQGLDKAQELNARQQTAGEKAKQAAPAEAAKESARNAEQAGQLADQSAKSAEQAAKEAEQSAKDAAAQAAAAKSATQAADQAANQAEQAARQNQGKPGEQSAMQAAENARRDAAAARQNEREAAQDAQDAQRAGEQARQQAQEAAKSANAAQQAAQEASRQAQQAAQAQSPHAVAQKQESADEAAQKAAENALAAAQAADRARQSAGVARREAEALRLSDLARQQEELQREAEDLIAAEKQAVEKLGEEVAGRVLEEQQALARAAEAMAQEMGREDAPANTARQAARAAQAAGEAARQLQQDQDARARYAAADARKALEQVAGAMQDALRAMEADALQKPDRFGAWASQAEELADRQGDLARQMAALAENEPLDALQQRQEQVGREAGDLARESGLLQVQAAEALPQPQGTRPSAEAAQAAQSMQQARQAAQQAAQQMQSAGQPMNNGAMPSPQAMRQAAQQAGQQQQQAVQALQQAARNLQQAASAAGKQVAQPGEPSWIEGYQSAREAEQAPGAAKAGEAAAQLRQAAQQAGQQARDMGVDPKPATLQAASSGGTGNRDLATESDEVPNLGRRLGLRLQDWLRVHGELKDDVLRAIHSDGPEEYRPMIQRYFREVSRHGEEK